MAGKKYRGIPLNEVMVITRLSRDSIKSACGFRFYADGSVSQESIKSYIDNIIQDPYMRKEAMDMLRESPSYRAPKIKLDLVEDDGLPPIDLSDPEPQDSSWQDELPKPERKPTVREVLEAKRALEEAKKPKEDESA